MRRADTLIVGGGIIGACILRRLTEAGHQCVLVEQRRAGLGATGYSGAMVRLAHPVPKAVAAAGAGLRAYSQIESETGGRLALQRCGHLYFGAPAQLQDILTSVQAVSPTARLMTAQQIAERFGGMHVLAEAAIFEPEAGYADPVAFTRYQVAQAVQGGAILCEATTMQHLLVSGGRITGAATSGGEISAAQVVLASGAHTPAILAAYGLTDPELWAQHIQVGQFQLGRGTGGWPGFVDDGQSLNGLPGPGPRQYFLGLPTGQHADPVACRPACPDHAARTLEAASRRLPFAEHAQPAGALCHPDCYGHDPIGAIGPVAGGPEGLYLATGFSGGGFKMAPYAADCIHQHLC